jgi:hypothetical protein
MFDRDDDPDGCEHPGITFGTMQTELARLSERQQTLRDRLAETEQERDRLLSRLIRFQGRSPRPLSHVG